MQAASPARVPEAALARLAKLLAYIGEVVRLDERPAFRLADHRLATGQRLVLHRHETADLPGLTLDLSDDDGPVWLRLERLKRIDPPAPPESAAPWLDVSPDPEREPVVQPFLIRTVPPTKKDALVAAGEARPEDCAEAAAEPGLFDVRLRLEDRSSVVADIEGYRRDAWLIWAEAERPRRRAIALYQKLFELAQLADLGGLDEPFELVWGIGLARWRMGEREIDLPLVERLVEIEIDEAAGAQIRIRPRALPAAVNLRPYEELKVEGAMLAGDAARRGLAAAEADDGVSPFRSEDFEPALRACQTRLAASGGYEPDLRRVGPADPPPEPDGQLLVTDRWVLFARRRSDSFILRDLETLKDAVDTLEASSELPAPARTLVSGPAAGPAAAAWQPLGNQIGATGPELALVAEEDAASGDLFFPKPFNDDQIEIVRRLEVAEGLVVQGPPGTGKTHTIANVICHMMATGRRVLVVSHGEPALAVLRNQLPEGVRDLAISVTATERDGLRQLETAVRLLQSIVEGMRPREQLARIRDAEAMVVRLRARLAAIDAELAQIAKRQLEPTLASGKRAAELAAEVASKRTRFAWFPDRPRTFMAESGVAEAEVERLRALRARLGSRVEHGEAVLPAVSDLPDGAAIA
ncbi:MAG TPA: AAA domain-containing protein, partial [Beijerinckiaceae bacterium]|nr:AAA domain-containing protein [Beijerinckiaceae bacterium]